MHLHLQAARLKLLKEMVYLSSALLSMHPVEVPGLKTMGVDMWWRLYYDPKVCDVWAVEEIATILYHEVYHLLEDHPQRCEALAAIPQVWNRAADVAVNRELKREGRPFPKGTSPLFPETFGLPDDLLTEDYYYRLVQQAKGQGQGAGQEKGEGAGGSGAHSGGGPNPSPKGEGPSSSDVGSSSSDVGSSSSNPSPSGEEPPAPGQGRCGSCAHGQKEWWELDAPANRGGPSRQGMNGEVPGISNAEAALIRRQVAHAIEEHIRNRGSVPGHWARWANQKLVPHFDWKQVIASEIRRAVADVAGMRDYSYKRPSRRQSVFPDIVMPALREPAVRVAVVVDTSGSISDRMLNLSLGHIAKILQACGLREGVTVLPCDSAVYNVQRVFRAEQVKLRGGGGTAMQAGVDAAVKTKPKPDIVIVLTDGCTGWGQSAPPQTRVIVGLLDSRGSCPVWAKKVLIDEAAA